MHVIFNFVVLFIVDVKATHLAKAYRRDHRFGAQLILIVAMPHNRIVSVTIKIQQNAVKLYPAIDSTRFFILSRSFVQIITYFPKNYRIGSYRRTRL
jgi:hypothetical protein